MYSLLALTIEATAGEAPNPLLAETVAGITFPVGHSVSWPSNTQQLITWTVVTEDAVAVEAAVRATAGSALVSLTVEAVEEEQVHNDPESFDEE